MKMGNWPQSRHAGVADLRARPTSSLLVEGTESGETLQGSFPAESKPVFANKHPLESSRRDLHNARRSKTLKSQYFVSKLLDILQNAVDFFKKLP